MTFGHMDPPLLPKDGRRLRVIVPVRVSDPTKQEERSLGEQQNTAGARMVTGIRGKTFPGSRPGILASVFLRQVQAWVGRIRTVCRQRSTRVSSIMDMEQ